VVFVEAAFKSMVFGKKKKVL